MNQPAHIRNIARLQKYSQPQPNGCINFIGCRDSRGYGFCRDSQLRKQEYAHRLAYRTFVADLPQGKIVLHKCNNPSCINPLHLVAGTNQENSDQMVREKRHRTVTRPKHSLEKIASIKADLRDGKTAYSVSKSTGVSEQYVNHIRRRLNLKPAGRKPKPPQPEPSSDRGLSVRA